MRYLADISCWTEAVGVWIIFITVTAQRKAFALDTLRIGRAGGIRIISQGITVTTRRKRRLTGAILSEGNS